VGIREKKFKKQVRAIPKLASKNCTAFHKICRATADGLVLKCSLAAPPPMEINFYGEFPTFGKFLQNFESENSKKK
jgi:hypothetical protein